MMVTTAAPPAPGPSSRVWFAAAIALAAAATIYWPVALGLGRQWLDDPNTAYGALVAGAAIVALRQRLPRLRTTPISGSWGGAAALLLAAAVYVAGTLSADLFLLRTSFVAFGAATIWFVCGTAFVRVLAVPLILCLAAIPLPNALVTELTMPLQLAASQCAALLLGLAGADVVREGNVLTLSYITLEVAEACSGMRSLVTLLALVAVYWGTIGTSLVRGLLLVAATVPVALVGNGLRVTFTALLASRMGEDASRGLVHDATGFGTFVVMGTAMIGVHLLASRCLRRPELAA